MTQAQIFDIARDAIYTMLIIAGPTLLIGLAIGLLISLFQALTSLQEATLTFVPKILVIFATMIVLLPYMVRHIREFTRRVMDVIVSLP